MKYVYALLLLLCGCASLPTGQTGVMKGLVVSRAMVLDDIWLDRIGWSPDRMVSTPPYYAAVGPTGQYCYVPVRVWAALQDGSWVSCLWHAPRSGAVAKPPST